MHCSRKGSAVLSSVAGLILFGGVFIAGIYVGVTNRPEIEKVAGLYNEEQGKPETIDFAPFWKAWNIINDKYVSADSASDNEKVWGAISGLTASLGDAYSVFFTPDEFAMFRESITGNFEGVGMEVGMRDRALTVIAPLKDTPAFRAGVKSGDRILAIDGTVTVHMSLEKAVSLIRGDRGSRVELTVYREEEAEPIIISIVRDVITIPTIEVDIMPTHDKLAGADTSKLSLGQIRNGVFIIRLFNFNANASDQFRGALRQFVESGSEKLIIDLRDNPGGFLEAAVDIASWFLPAGEVIVKEEHAYGVVEREFRSKGYNIFNKKIRIAILINSGSASASEILAGALQEHGVATLVGEKSFGKGSVQELIEITPNTAMKLTIAKWLTPNGISISEGGLTPDVTIGITKEDIENKQDPQMDKAIEILNK
jgi:carboxyl-terminal processing protease